MLADALSGLRQPTEEEVAFVKALNEKFIALEDVLGVSFRAYCGGKHGFMVRRFVEGCDTADTLSSHKPIGMGPIGLEAYFRKHYNLGWQSFLSMSTHEIEARLNGRDTKSPPQRRLQKASAAKVSIKPEKIKERDTSAKKSERRDVLKAKRKSSSSVGAVAKRTRPKDQDRGQTSQAQVTLPQDDDRTLDAAERSMAELKELMRSLAA